MAAAQRHFPSVVAAIIASSRPLTLRRVASSSAKLLSSAMSTTHSLSMPFKVSSWDETTLHQLDTDSKITRAAITYSLTPTAPLTAANIAVDYLMSHGQSGDEAEAQFVGFARLTGQWQHKEATLVLREVGSYKKGTGTDSQLTVVEGSGRGPWVGAKGHGTAKAGHAGGSIELTLQLAA